MNCFLVLLLCATACFGQEIFVYEFSSNYRQAPAHNIQAVTKASNSLGLSLYREISRSGNVFLSPLGVSMAMGMVLLGAKGPTGKEMSKVLGYESSAMDPDSVAISFKEIIERLRSSTRYRGERYILEIANAILVDRSFVIDPSFRQKGQMLYDAAVESVNFASDPETAMQSINGWASWKTRNKISQILQEPLNPLTKLFILNAVYFKGTWKTRFDQRLTMPDTFYNDGKVPTTVPMMRQRRKHHYGFVTKLQSHALELPYDGGHITMLLLLPEKRDGLRLLESQLSQEILESIPKTLRLVTVQVTLPRFTLEEEYDMITLFKGLGMRSVFDANQANLTGISSRKGLHLSKVIHKTVIEVNEEGSEAAAVSGMSAGVRTGGPLYPLFTADHPFMFLIRDATTGATLFMGRVNHL